MAEGESNFSTPVGANDWKIELIIVIDFDLPIENKMQTR